MWFPNFLSGVRIVVAVIFPFLSPVLRLPFVVLALLTEYFDGALARKYNWVTSVGQILDPVADKLFALSVGLTLVVAKKLLLWQLLFISFRDITVTAGFLIFLLFSKNMFRITSFQPHFLGKTTTVFQYLVFLSALLLQESLSWILYITGALSVFSAILYFIVFFNQSSKTLRSST